MKDYVIWVTKLSELQRSQDQTQSPENRRALVKVAGGIVKKMKTKLISGSHFLLEAYGRFSDNDSVNAPTIPWIG